MQCPHCSALCANSDAVCPRCGRSLGKGLTQSKVANWTAFVFGVLMLVFVAYMSMKKPATRQTEVIAMAITNALFISAAAVVGRIVGWLLGAFVCRE
jgi:uncharacterized paraquat-inducible protein A